MLRFWINISTIFGISIKDNNEMKFEKFDLLLLENKIDEFINFNYVMKCVVYLTLCATHGHTQIVQLFYYNIDKL